MLFDNLVSGKPSPSLMEDGLFGFLRMSKERCCNDVDDLLDTALAPFSFVDDCSRRLVVILCSFLAVARAVLFYRLPFLGCLEDS